MRVSSTTSRDLRSGPVVDLRQRPLPDRLGEIVRSRRLVAAALSASLLAGGAALPAFTSPAVAAASSTAPASGWKARPATYGVATTKDVALRMSDGVVLRADVLRPAKADGTPAPG